MMTPHGLSPSHAHLRELPIGLFDSGVGGMTVLRAMREQLPNESFLYLGDTARTRRGKRVRRGACRKTYQAVRGLNLCNPIKHAVRILPRRRIPYV